MPRVRASPIPGALASQIENATLPHRENCKARRLNLFTLGVDGSTTLVVARVAAKTHGLRRSRVPIWISEALV